MAAPAAMPDQLVGQRGPVLAREERHKVGLNAIGISLFGPAEAARESAHMRVHGNARCAERIAEHNVGGLATDPRQGDQILKPIGHLPAKVIAQGLRKTLNAGGLGAVEPRGLDERLKFFTIGARVRRGVGVALEQCGGHLIHSAIGALRRQHGGHQQLQRCSEIQLTVRVRIRLGEHPSDLASTTNLRGSGRRLGRATGTRSRGRHSARVRRTTPQSANDGFGGSAFAATTPIGETVREGGVVDDVLMHAPLFSALDAEGAAAMRTSMEERRVPRGDTIFIEGEPGDRMYVILDGKIKLGQTSPDGRESLLAVLGPGEVFGELSLFDPGPRTATATAVTDSMVIGLGHESLRTWLTGRPEVAEALLQALARRLRRTNEALADLVFSDVPGRVAKQLLDLADKFGQPGPDGVLVHHDLTQEELAQLVGASRETVNKALADFTARGWIQVDQREVILLDMERLARRAR